MGRLTAAALPYFTQAAAPTIEIPHPDHNGPLPCGSWSLVGNSAKTQQGWWVKSQNNLILTNTGLYGFYGFDFWTDVMVKVIKGKVDKHSLIVLQADSMLTAFI